MGVETRGREGGELVMRPVKEKRREGEEVQTRWRDIKKEKNNGKEKKSKERKAKGKRWPGETCKG